MDIIYNDSKFRPERSITQGEFMEMLKGINPSLYRKYVRIAEGSRDEQFPLDIDNINPEATLTNEQATVFFVEMLGYSDIATIENIFKCDFKDADKISSEFYGFVALCKGLGILDDFKENFSPQSDLTRGNAALMIYNYLDR